MPPSGNVSAGSPHVRSTPWFDETGLARVLDELCSGSATGLLVNPGAMGLDGAQADAVLACDFGVGVAEGNQPQNLLLLVGEGERPVPRLMQTRQPDAE